MSIERDDERIFAGAFKKAYFFVNTVAIYSGTFLACYFWPRFLAAATNAVGPPQAALGGTLLTPLGFLVLGLAQGKRLLISHVLLLAVAVALAWALTPIPVDASQFTILVNVWTAIAVGMYILGASFAWRHALRQ